ncbi:hypothetical protein FACS189498_1950 [Spirochaetia bacterium]|nr:hypothetical protein FACS189498_1950 [Spirochaetia bacterium]
MKRYILAGAAVFVLLSACVTGEFDREAGSRASIAATAKQYLGTPYKYGGTTAKGFDCSGFIWFVYHKEMGMELPRTTGGLWDKGRAVNMADLKPGDILVFATVKKGPSHAGIVLENSKTGVTFIHAASDGPKTGVIVSGLNEAYYKKRLMGARSFLR